MGLGSIVGTGVFVSIGIAAGVAGPAVLVAIAVAAAVGACNALSSAQLAARYPVSGGTYEYGYARLTPALGFTAGWLFLCAKSASAATAALGFSGYLLLALGADRALLVPVAAATAAVLTAVVLTGLRRSSAANVAVVSVTLAALAYFVLGGGWSLAFRGGEPLGPFFRSPEGSAPLAGLLEACALMFVAFTGYGRIATLGEEVERPERTIPRAIVLTVGIVAVLYLAVGYVAVAAIGAGALGEAARAEAAPLERAAQALAVPGLAPLVALGAMAAMLGVLLNLILGLSRVLLAMGRRRDMPRAVTRLNRQRTTPTVATAAAGAVVLGLTLLGDVRLTWSFSAFTVLLYYAITNAAALRLPPADRLYPRALAWGGLASCLFLAFWVPVGVWIAGLAVVGAGLAVRGVLRGIPGW